MTLKFSKAFKKNVGGRFGKYQFEVGIIDDGPYKIPKKGARGLRGQDVIKQYAGGPIRQSTRRNSGMTLSQVSKQVRKFIGVNYLKAPFKSGSTGASANSSDIRRFLNEFFKLSTGKSQKRRAENLLQAVVRNPILRLDYIGANSDLTKKIKGFNRPLFDTGQFFRSIKARCSTRRLF